MGDNDNKNDNQNDNNFLLTMIIFILAGIILAFLIGPHGNGTFIYYGMGGILVGVTGLISELWRRFKK
jgi:hypothetical protein